MNTEWVFAIVLLSVTVSAMALFYANQSRIQIRNLTRLGEVQGLLLSQAKLAYGKSSAVCYEDAGDKALRILYKIEKLPKTLNRRNLSELQVDVLNEILSLNDAFFRSVLLRRLAETCIEHGSIDVGKTVLSYITDDRVLENCSYMAEMEQRRISRLNLISAMTADEGSSAAVEDNVTKFRR